MPMRILRFPKTLTLELSDPQRETLERVMERHPNIQSDHELLSKIIERGLASPILEDLGEGASVLTVAERMTRRLEEMERDSDEPEMRAAAESLRPFPKPWQPKANPREILPYVASPIGESLRKRLNAYLNENDLDEEEGVVRLLEIGLKHAGHAERKPPTVEEVFGRERP